MAKRLLKWEVSGSILTAVAVDDATLRMKFNVVEVFPDYNELTDVRKLLVLNGLKQKLADAGAIDSAKEPTAMDKLNAANKIWKNLLAGIWSERGTGTREPKVAVSKLREELLAQGISEAVVDSVIEKLHGSSAAKTEEKPAEKPAVVLKKKKAGK